MVSVNLKSLIDKLDVTCRDTLEAAVGLTLSQTHYNTEIEHWLLKLLDVPNSDLEVILSHYEIDKSRLIQGLTKTLDNLKRGNARSPTLSPSLVELTQDAWMLASIEFNAQHTRSGHLLCALLNDETMVRQLSESSRVLANLSSDALHKALITLTENSAEAESVSLGTVQRAIENPKLSASRTSTLDQYTIDLTQRAQAGEIDPVLGRDVEIRQMIDILSRRRQNNPILTGEAGVGKTALAEGLALRIAAGDVPPTLQKVSIRTLDLALLQAGAGVRGEFENRLKSVVTEIKASMQSIILFIDEAHTLVGVGGQAGQNDAANILKPALARGELRTIAATTWAEYKKYFEGDAALARRFQVVKVDEPTEPMAVAMLQGTVKILEKHHGVRILDEAVNEAVRLSHRYISGRQLPDKAVSLLDTACARVSLSNTATPAAIEDCRRQAEQINTTIRILEREMVVGGEHNERLLALKQEEESLATHQLALEQRWQKERELVEQAHKIRLQLEDNTEAGQTTSPIEDVESQSLCAELEQLMLQLKKLQGETPLMQVYVDAQVVAEVVAAWTGIPVGRMVKDEINAILNLKQRMENRIVGQSHALEAIAQKISTARANLADPRRPIGTFLLAGTSGVGKTETALALAELLYGSEQNLTVINMSEFKEEHKVSLLMGSPPGYVGYGEGGVLTEAVRRKPYSIILLDEMEKAHPGVQDVFYQVFDKGMLRDGEGRDIDFKNNIIIMTSNAGTETIMKYNADPETMPDAAGLAEALRPELLKTFKPAFLGRVTLVPYFPLKDEIIQTIVKLQLNRISKRVQDNYHAQFEYSPELVTSIAGRCHEVDSGARNIDHILNHALLPELAAKLLAYMADGKKMSCVKVGLDVNEHFQYEVL